MGENAKKKAAKKPRKKTAKRSTKKSTSKEPGASSGKAKKGRAAPGKPERAAWLDRHLWEVQPVRDVLVVVGIIALFWLGQKISIVTVPLLLAMLFAYLLEPVVALLMAKTRLERKGSVNAIIAAMVFLIVVPAIFAVTFGVVQGASFVSRAANSASLVSESIGPNRIVNDAQRFLSQTTTEELLAQEPEESEADEGGETQPGESEEETGGEDPAEPSRNAQGEPLRKVAPGVYAKAQTDLADNIGLAQSRRKRVREVAGNAWLWIHDRLANAEEGGTANAVFNMLYNWLESNQDERLVRSAVATGASVLQTTFSYAARAFAIFFMIFLTAFFFYFMATGWPQVRLFVAKLIPDKKRGLLVDLGGKFDKVISAFIRGRLTIAFIQSIVFTFGYLLIGVPAAFILGPVVAVLSIVPYLASVGIPISIALLWFENHTGVRGSVAYVLIAPTVFYFIGQALDDYVWTPKIQGKSTGMSTPAILFASIAGGVLFGVFGLLIAIPLAACLKILLDEIFWPHFKDWTEGKTKDLLPFGGGDAGRDAVE